MSDGGNYTCSPQNIVPDSVSVTIMDGEGKSAAVYKDHVTSDASQINAHRVLMLYFMSAILFLCQ